MKLRSHLVILVLGTVLPVLAFSAVMAVFFWHQQRVAYDERYLERVRALALALDREHDGHIRALHVLTQSAALQRGDLPAFYAHAQRVITEQPGWASVILADRSGAQIFDLRRPLGTSLAKLTVGDEIIASVVTTGQPAVSPLVSGPVSGDYITAVIVPVRRDGAIAQLLVAVLPPRLWLDMLARYPIARGATMTLLDQNGVIIARTLNHERWVGKPPSAGLLAEIRQRTEGAYRNVSALEGQRFYSAHSRLAVSGWRLATGVPADSVESALRESAIAMTLGAVAMASLAVALALLLGRRIARPVAALTESVTKLGAGEPVQHVEATGIEEVAAVAHAFEEAAGRLTARENALRELAEGERAARAEAEAANRMKDEFLAVLSHELRTPINAVFGWARLLRQAPASPTLGHGLEVIERNAAAQVRLIDDLLDVSRIVTGKMRLDVRPVDMAAAVEGAVESVRHAAQAKEIRLESVLDPRAGPVNGDPDRLRQVVWNLLSNAIKFTPKGGRVQVRLARAGSRVEIVVADTGPGIPADLLPHIFERFRQGDSTSTRAHGGLGLGLSLVRHIVELHGGTVRAETAPGSGATFVVELPVSLGTAALAGRTHPTAPEGAATMPAVSLRGVRVLVVDDDRDSVDLFARVIRATGAELQTAMSTAEAMQIFDDWSPDVLVSDIEMPGEDGYALIRRVRQKSTVPAVAVTAYSRVEDRVRLLAAGYTMHVPKPVEPAELIAVLASITHRTN